ncbi:hypothetical protein EP073_10635 [Geovibrio thiophilus]|uniref:Uncharacterized protein n=1 Tax=Geovibrio thiophilus TaxID=139438 RepID=A0A3R5UYV3_9BACT|nr:hypothetical protein EP073_10635 [Geovibrio thiophilus]
MTDIQGIIVLICIAAVILNLPFGYLRRFTKRFSLAWFACIHIPIVFIAVIRISTHTPWAFAPLFLAMGILGQMIGYRINFRRREQQEER